MKKRIECVRLPYLNMWQAHIEGELTIGEGYTKHKAIEDAMSQSFGSNWKNKYKIE